jgi:hypothetical protein
LLAFLSVEAVDICGGTQYPGPETAQLERKHGWFFIPFLLIGLTYKLGSWF